MRVTGLVLPLVEKLLPSLKTVGRVFTLDNGSYEPFIAGESDHFDWPDPDERTASTRCSPPARPDIRRACYMIIARPCCTTLARRLRHVENGWFATGDVAFVEKIRWTATGKIFKVELSQQFRDYRFG